MKQSNPKTRICKICFKPIEETTFHSLFHKDCTICHNCFLALEPRLNEFKFEGVNCLNIYFYTEKVQELLYQFKGCKDFELRTIFLEYYRDYLRTKYRNYTLIPAPSFKENDEERGFNHVVAMFKTLGLPMCECIEKINKVKQADLTREERQNIYKSLVIKDVDLKGEKVLIVDDVFTTGSTVRAMIRLLKTKKPSKIAVLVMSKTLDLEDR